MKFQSLVLGPANTTVFFMGVRYIPLTVDRFWVQDGGFDDRENDRNIVYLST